MCLTSRDSASEPVLRFTAVHLLFGHFEMEQIQAQPYMDTIALE